MALPINVGFENQDEMKEQPETSKAGHICQNFRAQHIFSFYSQLLGFCVLLVAGSCYEIVWGFVLWPVCILVKFVLQAFSQGHILQSEHHL